jgi:histidinol-phosphatase (PHP family)
MEQTCERAIALGLPAVAFTEHADYTRWTALPRDLEGNEILQPFAGPDGVITAPALDLDGYLECVQRCRDKFPGLRIITGVELGEPHWHPAEAAGLLRAGGFDRVLGSLHSLKVGQRYFEPPGLYHHGQPVQVVRDYLAEIPRMVTASDTFSVLAHIDYVLRYWPVQAGPFDPVTLQDDFRHALRALAEAGRFLEVNTSGPLHPEIIRWWHEEGGQAVTFGSDAHEPALLARGFTSAAAMVEAQGFRPGHHPYDVWPRSD